MGRICAAVLRTYNAHALKVLWNGTKEASAKKYYRDSFLLPFAEHDYGSAENTATVVRFHRSSVRRDHPACCDARTSDFPKTLHHTHRTSQAHDRIRGQVYCCWMPARH